MGEKIVIAKDTVRDNWFAGCPAERAIGHGRPMVIANKGRFAKATLRQYADVGAKEPKITRPSKKSESVSAQRQNSTDRSRDTLPREFKLYGKPQRTVILVSDGLRKLRGADPVCAQPRTLEENGLRLNQPFNVPSPSM